MTIEITAQNIITASALLSAVAAILALVFKGYDWYKKQNAQEAEMEEIRHTHSEDVKAIKEEQTVLVYGVLACLKGLREQGCNGPVSKAIDKLEKHLNIEAHK